MKKCYEYLGCENRTCPMHGRKDDVACWEVLDTSCSSHSIPRVALRGVPEVTKREVCEAAGCEYLKYATKSQTPP